MTDVLAPSLPHEIYPAPTLGDRICGPCYDLTEGWHPFEEHVIELRGGAHMRCDQRNGAGERVCSCREFACIEHPDNACGDVEG